MKKEAKNFCGVGPRSCRKPRLTCIKFFAFLQKEGVALLPIACRNPRIHPLDRSASRGLEETRKHAMHAGSKARGNQAPGKAKRCALMLEIGFAECTGMIGEYPLQHRFALLSGKGC